MAKVPYVPIPDVAPVATQAPKPSINAPVEAFGSAEAEATSGFGKELERAGNELFQRAIAIQTLNNQTEARDADTKFIIAAGELHANYSSLEGRDRVNAYPQYAKDLQGLREQVRSGMSNDAARRLFDSSSLPTLGRSIFSGAASAASANKKWTKDVVKSQLELDLKTIENNPNDEAFFKEKLRKIEEGASNLAAQQGIPPGSAPEKLAILEAKSKAWRNRITGLARVAPFEAAKLLDKNKSQLTDDDYLRVDAQVRTQGRAVGAANIANEVYDPSKTLDVMEGEARAKAKAFNPNDPLLAENAISDLRTKYNQTKYAKRQEQDGAKDAISGLIQEHRPNNLQELLALPGAEEAYERLTEVQQNALPGQINRYNSSVGKYDREQTYLRLKGMANSDDPEARAAFLNLDITKEDLSQGQIDNLWGIQRKMKATTSGDPRVVKAVTWLRGAMGAQLEALGIYRRTEDNVEDYDHYIGALQSALDVWNETHKSPATYKDIVETIGPQIIRERTEPGWLWNSQVPFFKQEVPSDFAARARSIAKDPYLPDEQIYKLWVRMQYKSLYAKPPPKTQERAPQ